MLRSFVPVTGPTGCENSDKRATHRTFHPASFRCCERVAQRFSLPPQEARVVSTPPPSPTAGSRPERRTARGSPAPGVDDNGAKQCENTKALATSKLHRKDQVSQNCCLKGEKRTLLFCISLISSCTVRSSSRFACCSSASCGSLKVKSGGHINEFSREWFSQ